MITEKSQREENRLSHEHTQQVRDLHQDLLEAEQRLDDLTETHDVQIQVPHTRPCRVGSVGSVSASRTVGREFASRPGHTKDHHKNGANCLPA